MTRTNSINEKWSNYDKSIAKSQLDNYGWIYLDKYGCPIDNVWETDEMYYNDLFQAKEMEEERRAFEQKARYEEMLHLR